MKRENTLQDQCAKYLAGRGIYYEITWGNAYESRGRPDLIICYKGRFIGCELKRPGKKPDPLQRKRLRDITENGGIGTWITSPEELKSLLLSLDSESASLN